MDEEELIVEEIEGGDSSSGSSSPSSSSSDSNVAMVMNGDLSPGDNEDCIFENINGSYELRMPRKFLPYIDEMYLRELIPDDVFFNDDRAALFMILFGKTEHQLNEQILIEGILN